MATLLVAFVLGVLLMAFIFRHRSAKPAKAKAVRPPNAGKGENVYTKAEISRHNTRKDCWIIIKDKVYDVTSYVEEHPGGDAILTHAGDDSTEGFYGPQHATRVFDMIGDFYVGDLQL